MDGLFHVGNDAIGYNQQYIVVFAVLVLLCNGDCIIYYGRKVARTEQFNLFQRISVKF